MQNFQVYVKYTLLMYTRGTWIPSINGRIAVKAVVQGFFAVIFISFQQVVLFPQLDDRLKSSCGKGPYYGGWTFVTSQGTC